MKFHHIGIPTTEKKANETYLEGGKLFVTDIEASEHNIEWLRFEEGSPMPQELQTTAHVAYVVDNMAEALKDHEVLMEPFSPAEGLNVAFVLEDGAPVEYMEFV